LTWIIAVGFVRFHLAFYAWFAMIGSVLPVLPWLDSASAAYVTPSAIAIAPVSAIATLTLAGFRRSANTGEQVAGVSVPDRNLSDPPETQNAA